MPESAGICRENPNVENEPAAARPLSLRQHAAARFLARGYGSVDIARGLGVNRHTIGRWKRQPAFVAEIERLRRELTSVIVSPAAEASPRRPPRPLDSLASLLGNVAPIHAGAKRSAAPAAADANLDRYDLDDNDNDNVNDDDAPMTDEEAAETEAWIEQIVRAKHAGKKIPPPPPGRDSL